MRGNDVEVGDGLVVIHLEQCVPQNHPLRRIRKMVDQGLRQLRTDLDALYAELGRPSIPPEWLLRALLLQILYSIRSETLLVEQIRYNLQYRWFVGLGGAGETWDRTVFTKNRDRLLASEVAQGLLEAVLDQARAHDLLSDEHFTVDGTMIEAWAGRKSFIPKDPPDQGSGTRGRICLRDKIESTTDREARLYKKSTAGESKPCYLGHVIIENRHGLVVAACATPASATAERTAGLAMLDQMGLRADRAPVPDKQFTLGADKAYQEKDFLEGLRKRHVAPHVAEYEKPSANRPNYLTDAERNDPGLPISQQKRKLVEMVFGWGKLDSILRKTKLQGQRAVDGFFRLLALANNLVRLVKLIPA